MGKRIQFGEFGAAFIGGVITQQRVQQSIDQVVDQVLRDFKLPPKMEGHDVRGDVRKGGLRVQAKGVGQFAVGLRLDINFSIKLGPLVENYRVQADVGFALEVQTWTPLELVIVGPPVAPASVAIKLLSQLGTTLAWGKAEGEFKKQIAEAISGAISKGQKIDVLAALAKMAPVDRPRPRARVDYPTFGTEFLRHAINAARLQKEIATAAGGGMVGTDRVGPANIAYRVSFRGVQVIGPQNGHFNVTLQLGINLEIVIARIYKDEFAITATVQTGVQVSVWTPCAIGIQFDPVTPTGVTLSKANIRGPGLTWGQVEPALKTQILNSLASALAYRQFDVAKMVDQSMGGGAGPRKNAAGVRKNAAIEAAAAGGDAAGEAGGEATAAAEAKTRRRAAVKAAVEKATAAKKPAAAGKNLGAAGKKPAASGKNLAAAGKKPAASGKNLAAAEKKPAEKKPAEKKPAEKKPAEKKPAEKKPAEKKPAEKRPTTRRK